MGFFGLCLGKQSTLSTVIDGESFLGMYEKTGELLGEGAYSTVEEVRSRRNGKVYAAKVIEKKSLQEDDIVGLHQEIEILKAMKHPNIITLYDVFNDRQRYYLVTEKMEGGELFDRIMRKTFYNEKDARDVSKILFEAIGFCHAHKVAHRDLKPENLLLMSSENDLDIKIADFGFAKVANSDHSLLTRCGTPGYVCPEIIQGIPYGTKADMWSLGVIIYILLAGYPPFYSDSQTEMFKLIRRGAYEFHSDHWDNVSDDAKHLITRLLSVNPNKRITASGALVSGWIKNDQLESHDLGDNLATFKKFNAKRKLKQAVLTVIAAEKFLKRSLSTINIDEEGM